ncbi:MAG: chorismate mutase [Flavobacteriaceae bacterium]|nr:chorismate mutase [Flavobacteriaceae bacterium]
MVETRLSEHRNKIDEIDQQLLILLNRRAECAIEIGQIKKENNMPIYVPEREEKVIETLVQANTGPLPQSAIREIFLNIFDQMKKLE